MENRLNPNRRKILILIPLVVILGIGAYFALRGTPTVGPGPVPESWEREVPIVFRTQGGLLEVAGFDFTEDFVKSDTRKWWGVYLGTTVSRIQVPAKFRYHIELEREWEVVISGQTCLVKAPEIKPTLPVGIDTAGMRKETASGWARFNKSENLEDLERSLTSELAERAGSDKYIAQITEASRKTISEFIATWLLREHNWKNDEFHTVKVFFPGEVEESRKPATINVETKP